MTNDKPEKIYCPRDFTTPGEEAQGCYPECPWWINEYEADIVGGVCTMKAIGLSLITLAQNSTIRGR
jgi:hypothetical protein